MELRVKNKKWLIQQSIFIYIHTLILNASSKGYGKLVDLQWPPEPTLLVKVIIKYPFFQFHYSKEDSGK